MMPGENENILIRVVDDDAHMRGSLEFMLTAEGFAVKTYPSAQAFLTDDAPSRLMEAVYKAVAQTQANKTDPGEAVARWNTLTPKEKDVAKLLAKGLLNREVGIRLGGISVKTVQVHRSEINRKLGVKGVVELTEAVNRIRALLGEAAA